MIKFPSNSTEILGKLLVNFQKLWKIKKIFVNFTEILRTFMKIYAKIMKIFATYERKKLLRPFNKKN